MVGWRQRLKGLPGHFHAIDSVSARWRLWALLPLVALIGDFVAFPYVFHTVHRNSVPEPMKLKANDNITLGRYRGRDIGVFYGDLSDIEDLRSLVSPRLRALGIVHSHFLDLQGEASRTGAVGRAVMSVLGGGSREAASRFERFLRTLAGSSAGQSHEFIVEGLDSSFPLRSVHVVLLNRRDTAEMHLRNLSKGLRSTLESEGTLGIDAILVTTMALDPRFRTIKPVDFFETLFDSIGVGHGPDKILIAFFENWPSPFLRDMTDSLNDIWVRRTAGSIGERAYRLEFRLALFLLSVCLIVSSLFTEIGLKNTLIISCGYLVPSIAAHAAVATLAAPYGPDFGWVGGVTVQVVFALFFPFIVQWDPRGLFGTAKRGTEDA